MEQLSMDMNNSTDAADEIEEESSEPQVYTISELNQAIRGILEGEFPLIWVRGEISNFTAHGSGHWYFSLKDKKAQVSAVMFRGFNSRLKFRPEAGMEVIVRGRVTVYEPRGNYQVFCELMDPVGAGALQKAFEQLKEKLEKEGLFDPARKRPLPKFPQHVAIVTSPTGAAIRDMLNVLGRRFSGLKITLVPAVVQGDQAPASIVQGIRLANQLKDADVLIVGRGGGSIEDLWGFNDESVARAIVASELPVISAVGHEIDFTIADFVADLRAPTPSAAAELVVQSAEEIKERLNQSFSHLKRCILHRLEIQKTHVQNLKRHLVDPRKRLQDLIQRNDELSQRLEASMANSIKRFKMQVELLKRRIVNPRQVLIQFQFRRRQAEEKIQSLIKNHLKSCRSSLKSLNHLLDSLSPLKVVDRGYAIVKADSKVLKSVRQTKAGETLSVRLKDGEIKATVTSISELNKS